MDGQCPALERSLVPDRADGRPAARFLPMSPLHSLRRPGATRPEFAPQATRRGALSRIPKESPHMHASRSLAVSRFRVASITLVALVLLALPATAAQRVVLFEEATNTSCGPCASANPVIAQVFDHFGDQLGVCKYHAWWPGVNDPFYQHNITPQRTRIQNYYGITGVPDVVVDGSNGPSPGDYNAMVAAINTRLGVASPLVIDCSGITIGDECQISVDVTVETPQAAADYRLFVALIEDFIEYNAANGEREHLFTFRHFNNNDTAPHGEPIDLGTAGLQEFDYTFPFDVGVYQTEEMSVTAWVQNVSTREVLQAGHAELLVPYIVDMTHTGPHTQIGGISEVVSFSGEIFNLGAWDDTYDIAVTGVPAGWSYSYTTPQGTFSAPSELPLVTGTSAPISIELDSQGQSGSTSITVTATSQGDPLLSAAIQLHKLNGTQVLLVDDDGGGEREIALGEALDASGVEWGLWDLDWGELTVDDLHTAATGVVWSCGDHIPTLTPNDRAALGSFMDDGGKLLVTGQEIGYDLADPTSPNFTPDSIVWFINYLHALYNGTYSTSLFLTGEAGDPIGDGLTLSLEPSGPNAQTTPDAIGPGTGADVVFTYDGTGSWRGGIKWTDGNAQVLYLSFGLEGVLQSMIRDEVMSRTLDWFGIEPVTGIADPAPVAPVTLALAQNTPNPFRPTTTIGYRLDAAGPVSLRVFDVHGRVVRELVSGVQHAALHEVSWDGRDDGGRMVASGIYFYRLETGSTVETRRMVLTR
jgi:hypothetical protein